MKTMQNSSISGRRNALPSRKEELAAKLFMGGIVTVIVAIDVLAISDIKKITWDNYEGRIR